MYNKQMPIYKAYYAKCQLRNDTYIKNWLPFYTVHE